MQHYGHHFRTVPESNFLGMYVDRSLSIPTRSAYSITDYSEDDVLTKLFSEKIYNLDIHWWRASKAGIFRLYGGPVAHIHLSSTSTLTRFGTYGQKFKDATYGYQAGFGFDIWKLRLGTGFTKAILLLLEIIYHWWPAIFIRTERKAGYWVQ